MKFHTLKFQIYLLLSLLINNLEFCVYAGDNSSNNTNNAPASSNNSGNSTSRPKIKYNNVSYKSINIYNYKIEPSKQYELSFPNKFEKIEFFDYIMEFDENARLPGVNVENIFIYTCKHYNPLIMYMYGNSRYYYYSLDTKTNKWTNHKIKYDKRFRNHTCENETIYYSQSISTSCLDKFKSIFTKTKFEAKQLSKERCEDGKCVNVDITTNNILFHINFFKISKDTKDVSDNIYGPSSDIRSPIAKDNNVNDIELTTNIEIVTPNCIYTSKANEKPKRMRFAYKVNNLQQRSLKYPNIIHTITFYDYIIEFDYDVKLPTINVENIYLYTCKHYKPILIYMYGNSRHYFYSLDYDVGKWTNRKIKYDTRFKNKSFENGIFYYNEYISNESTTTCVSCKTKNYEEKELVRRRCKKRKCLNMDITEDNKNLLISVIKPQIYTANCLYTYNTSEKPLMRGFVYELDNTDLNKLFHPNKIHKIEFMDYIIMFDENAKLPTIRVNKISIYTCKHYNPKLLYFSAGKRYYFYSFNRKTKKWKNRVLKYDKKADKLTDKNDTIFYIISGDENTATTPDKVEAKKLVFKHCKIYYCKKVNTTETNKGIEIYMKHLVES